MALFDQKELDLLEEKDWRYLSYKAIELRLTGSTDFPCIFAQRSMRRRLALLSFAPSISDESLRVSLEDLKEFIAVSRAWDGRAESARPLLMVFCLDKVSRQPLDLAGYHDVGWQILQYWHDHDDAPWPQEVGQDPNSPFWTMCCMGMQIFVNMSCPAHVDRRSRNLGDMLCLVVNPRERFDLVAGDTVEGRAIRTLIRNRIEQYDGLTHSPQLGSFQAGEIEWWQYGLLDENAPRLDKCPFKMRSP